MSLERFSTVMLALAIFFAFYLLTEQKNNQYQIISDDNHRKPFVKIAEEFIEPLTLWWPGISGQHPKYIEHGGLRGYGYGEYPLFKLKESLKDDYGVKIIDWFVTPSRLEEEFRLNRRPICVYPYEWTDPEKEFSTPRKKLLSYAFDFGDGGVSFIYVQKENRKNFLKHLDDKGRLKISNLIKDESLSTNLIKGETYPDPVMAAIQKTDGEWSVKPTYSKSIHLMVASENLQLIKMLAAGRIDYVFDHLLNGDMFRDAGVSPIDFATLNYKRIRIDSLRDQNLIRFSVKCNLHPTSFKIMPTLNEWALDQSRDWNAKISFDRHREKLESGYKGKNSMFGTFQFLFSNDLQTPDARWWYKKYKQNDGFGEPLKPIAKKVSTEETKPYQPTAKAKNLEREVYVQVLQNNESLMIIDPGMFSLTKGDYTDNFSSPVSLSTIYELPNYLTQDQRLMVRTTTATKTRLKELNFLSLDSLKSFAVIGSVVPQDLLVQLLKKIPKNLQELHIIHSNYKLDSQLGAFLTNDLKKLSLVGSDLTNLQIGKKIQKMNLLHLNLSSSELDHQDLASIFVSQRPHLKNLNFNNVNMLNKKSINLFANSPWQNLEVLNINTGTLAGQTLTQLLLSIGSNLRELYLGSARTNPTHFVIIHDRFPQLEVLVTKYPWMVMDGRETLAKLPENLRVLRLEQLYLPNNDLTPIKFPKRLEVLQLTQTKIGDKGLKHLSKFLTGNLKELSLTNLDVTSEASNSFIESGLKSWVPSLEKFSFSGNRFNDESLAKLLNHGHKLRDLDLSDNFLSDSIISLFDGKHQIESIDLSDNFFSKKGIIKLLQSPDLKNLKKLFLRNLLFLEITPFMENLPSHLEELDLYGYIMSERDSEIFLSRLPATLRELVADFQIPQKDGIRVLYDHMPPHLEYIGINDLKSGSVTVNDFLNRLPITLTALQLSGIKLEPNHSSDFSLPSGLKALALIGIKGTDKALTSLFSKVPLGLRHLDYRGQYPVKVYKTIGKKVRTQFEVRSVSPKDQIYSKVSMMSYHGGNVQILAQVLTNNPSFYFSTSFSNNPQNKLPKFPVVKNSNLGFLWLTGRGLTDEIAMSIPDCYYENLTYFMTGKSQITGKGIVHILKRLSPDINTFGFGSSKLKPQEVDDVIAHLPSGIDKLYIGGLQIGEFGYEKFREWREKVKKERGYSPDIGL